MPKLVSNARELADMISKDHLAQYADPDKKLPEANKYGVVVGFDQIHRLISFRVVTRNDEDVRFTLNINAFEKDPARTMFDMHNAIKGGIESHQKFKQERDSIIIRPNDTGDLATAVRSTLH